MYNSVPYSSNEQKVKAEDMLSASYMTGCGFSTIKTIINMTGRTTESRSTFFRHQAKSEDKLVECAEQLTEEARKNFSGYAAMDCRWSSPVRAIHGTVSAVDAVNRNVLEFAILTKNGKNRPTGNFDGSSNNMETVGTSIVIDKMKYHHIFEKVKKLIKDRDNKSTKLLQEIGAHDIIANDPGHYRNNFASSFDKLALECKNFTYLKDDDEITVKSPFYGMKKHIVKWLNVCLKEDDQDIRVAMWISCVPHYLGDHSNCSHSEDKKVFFWAVGLEHEPLLDIFIKFVDEHADIIKNVSNKYSTQSVESLNATYGRMAPKKSNCNRIQGKIASGIIRQNAPERAPFLIRQCCGCSPLSPEINQILHHDAQDLVKRRINSHDSEVMKKKNISRLKWRGKYQDDPNGDYGFNK